MADVLVKRFTKIKAQLILISHFHEIKLKTSRKSEAVWEYIIQIIQFFRNENFKIRKIVQCKTFTAQWTGLTVRQREFSTDLGSLLLHHSKNQYREEDVNMPDIKHVSMLDIKHVNMPDRKQWHIETIVNLRQDKVSWILFIVNVQCPCSKR